MTSIPLLFVLKKWLSVLLLPPVLPLWLAAVGWLLLKRRPTTARVLIGGSLLLTVLTSTPLCVEWLARPLEYRYPVLQDSVLQRWRPQVIIVLAGGRRSIAPDYGDATTNWFTSQRLRYAARLARRSGLPLLVSGGSPSGGRSEAELMADSLRDDYQLPTRWLETRSLDTADNAAFSAALLKPAGVQRVVLITDAMHMPRAVAQFQRSGLSVLPAPTHFLGGSQGETAVEQLPGSYSALIGHYALHEWLGLLQLTLRPADNR